MLGDRARSALVGTRFTDLRWVEMTGSTNDDAIAEARAGAPGGLVLVADAQLAGRGRLGRTWQAPPGSSLLVSILLRPEVGVRDAHLLVQAVALAAAQACSEVAGVSPRIKWPNDLLAPQDDRKLGGILAETVVVGDRLDALVVGLGLNVTWPEELPDDLASIAVALSHLRDGRDGEVDREQLLAVLLVHLDRWSEQLGSAEGREELAATYGDRCATIGSEVRVELATGAVTGTATGVEPDGALVVRTADGADHRIDVGDVVHLRPAPS